MSYVHRNILTTNNNNRQEGLGWIPQLIAALAAIAPVVIKMFKKPPKDQWSSWDAINRKNYVEQGLKVAAHAVVTGQANSIEQVMKPIIAQVELNDSWETWKLLNPSYVNMMHEATTEAEQAKHGHYNSNYKYVIKADVPIMAGLFNGSTTTWVISGIFLAGGSYYAYKKGVFKHDK